MIRQLEVKRLTQEIMAEKFIGISLFQNRTKSNKGLLMVKRNGFVSTCIAGNFQFQLGMLKSTKSCTKWSYG